MNDYKELIKELKVEFNECDKLISKKVHFNLSDAPIKKYAILAEDCCSEMVGIMQTISCAADAIEQLVKERNTAVDDLNIARSCLTCKGDGEDFCDGCDSWASKSNWEWRGVQE